MLKLKTNQNGRAIPKTLKFCETGREGLENIEAPLKCSVHMPLLVSLLVRLGNVSESFEHLSSTHLDTLYEITHALIPMRGSAPKPKKQTAILISREKYRLDQPRAAVKLRTRIPRWRGRILDGSHPRSMFLLPHLFKRHSFWAPTLPWHILDDALIIVSFVEKLKLKAR